MGMPASVNTGPAALDASSNLNDRSAVHIAPVGVNLGAIISPFNDGSPENGGFGLDIAARFIANNTSARVTPLTTTESVLKTPWIIGGIVVGGLALVFLIFRFTRRKR
jgi:hypothetical protein